MIILTRYFFSKVTDKDVLAFLVVVVVETTLTLVTESDKENFALCVPIPMIKNN